MEIPILLSFNEKCEQLVQISGFFHVLGKTLKFMEVHFHSYFDV